MSDCCGLHVIVPCYSVYATHIYTNLLFLDLVTLVSMVLMGNGSRKIIINRLISLGMEVQLPVYHM